MWVCKKIKRRKKKHEAMGYSTVHPKTRPDRPTTKRAPRPPRPRRRGRWKDRLRRQRLRSPALSAALATTTAPVKKPWPRGPELGLALGRRARAAAALPGTPDGDDLPAKPPGTGREPPEPKTAKIASHMHYRVFVATFHSFCVLCSRLRLRGSQLHRLGVFMPCSSDVEREALSSFSVSVCELPVDQETGENNMYIDTFFCRWV